MGKPKSARSGLGGTTPCEKLKSSYSIVREERFTPLNSEQWLDFTVTVTEFLIFRPMSSSALSDLTGLSRTLTESYLYEDERRHIIESKKNGSYAVTLEFRDALAKESQEYEEKHPRRKPIPLVAFEKAKEAMRVAKERSTPSPISIVSQGEAHVLPEFADESERLEYLTKSCYFDLFHKCEHPEKWLKPTALTETRLIFYCPVCRGKQSRLL